MASATTKLACTSPAAFYNSSPICKTASCKLLHHHHRCRTRSFFLPSLSLGINYLKTTQLICSSRINNVSCKATDEGGPSEYASSTASAAATSTASRGGVEAADNNTVDDEDGGRGRNKKKKWVPVVPLAALPKGERRVIIQDEETILLLWYKDQVVAIENRSPAEGAYSEGLLNAKLTQDGCIVCPTTESTYDLRTGAVKDWYPNNAVLRLLTPSLRSLLVYPVKTDEENIYIDMGGFGSVAATTDEDAGGVSAEIVFSGRAQPGLTASDVNVEEVRMVVDEDSVGFGFSAKNELINGKAAIIGVLLLIDFEALTGKGLLKGTGFLDFIYAASNAISSKL